MQLCWVDLEHMESGKKRSSSGSFKYSWEQNYNIILSDECSRALRLNSTQESESPLPFPRMKSQALNDPTAFCVFISLLIESLCKPRINSVFSSILVRLKSPSTVPSTVPGNWLPRCRGAEVRSCQRTGNLTLPAAAPPFQGKITVS